MTYPDRIPRINFSRPEARAAVAGALRVLIRPAWKQKAGRRYATPYQNLSAGDLLWVGEPYVEFVVRRRPAMMGIGYGGLMEARWPPDLKGQDCKVHPQPVSSMTRNASRMTVEVAKTRTFSLQSLDEELLADCAFQRVARNSVAGWMPYGETITPWSPSLREVFAEQWDRDNGRDHAWATNPPVVAIRPIIHLAHLNVVRARLGANA